jgi:hypothetical protein
MDEKDSVVLDSVPDEGEAEPPLKIADRER